MEDARARHKNKNNDMFYGVLFIWKKNINGKTKLIQLLEAFMSLNDFLLWLRLMYGKQVYVRLSERFSAVLNCKREILWKIDLFFKYSLKKQLN